MPVSDWSAGRGKKEGRKGRVFFFCLLWGVPKVRIFLTVRDKDREIGCRAGRARRVWDFHRLDKGGLSEVFDLGASWVAFSPLYLLTDFTLRVGGGKYMRDTT